MLELHHSVKKSLEIPCEKMNSKKIRRSQLGRMDSSRQADLLFRRLPFFFMNSFFSRPQKRLESLSRVM